MALPRELRNYINRGWRDMATREQILARQLVQIYDECRKELYRRLLEARAGEDTLKIQYLQGTLDDVERRLDHYTKLTITARQKNIEQSHLDGQEFAKNILRAGGMNINVAVGIGLINKGMVEALIGNIPQLAGKVKQDVLFKIRDELTKGAMMGESIPKIAKRVFGTGLTLEGLKKPMTLYTRSNIIARTETIKASDLGYEDMVVEAQRAVPEEIFDAWITAGDDRVEAGCRAIANGADGRFQSVPGYPGVYKRLNGPRPVVHTHPQ